jgi:hypothetical protein
MSLSLAIAANVLADIAMLGGLAYVMSRPARLTPHQQVLRPASAPAPVSAHIDAVRHDREAASDLLPLAA